MPNTMEQMASKGMGKAKQAKAAMTGLKGVFRMLSEEHGEVAVLLKRAAGTNDPNARAELFPKIRKELLSHERGELSELYPQLRSYDETRLIAEEHDREAGEMESLIDELETLSLDRPEWSNTCQRLLDIVQQHAKREEEEYFPRAQDVLGEKKSEQLGHTYKAKKESVLLQLG